MTAVSDMIYVFWFLNSFELSARSIQTEYNTSYLLASDKIWIVLYLTVLYSTLLYCTKKNLHSSPVVFDEQSAFVVSGLHWIHSLNCLIQIFMTLKYLLISKTNTILPSLGFSVSASFLQQKITT